jgi:hypothetical protein
MMSPQSASGQRPRLSQFVVGRNLQYLDGLTECAPLGVIGSPEIRSFLTAIVP